MKLCIRNPRVGGLALWMAATFGAAAAALPTDWFFLNPPPSPNTMWALHAADEIWLAVGEGGVIATTSTTPGPGVAWTQQYTGTGEFFFDVHHANGLWVAVGTGQTILTSPDAVQWTTRRSDQGADYLDSVHYGGDQWIVVGTGGRLLTSPDGVAWTTQTSGTTENLYAVHHADGRWVAAGVNGVILTSTNGTAWSPRPSGTTANFDAVRYGDGQWLAVGGSGTYATSTNGLDWQAATITVTGVTISGLSQVHQADGLWVVTAYDGEIFQSPDAVHWQRAGTAGATTSFTDVHYSEGQWVATSEGALYWAPAAAGILQFEKAVGVTDLRIVRVSHHDGRYVAAAVNGTVITSSNGSDWSSATVDDNPDLNQRNWLQGVAFGDGLWILAGDRGSIWRSADANTWDRLSFADSTGFQSVHHASAQWVLVGNGGDIRTSPDGTNWTKRVSGTSARIRAVHYQDGVWVTGGNSGEVLTSTNAQTWTVRRRQAAANANEQLWDVEFGAGRWVAVGQKGSSAQAFVLTSTNAVSWTETPAPGSALQSVHHFEDLWVATGQNGTLLTSPDGLAWTGSPPFTGNSLADAIRVEGRWTLVGNLGLIARGVDPTAVLLGLAHQGSDQLVFSWPVEAAGWVLKSASIVDGSYVDLGLAPSVVGDRRQVVIPRSAGQAFFRLVRDR